MGRHSISCMEGLDMLNIEGAVDSLLSLLFKIHHGTNRFPQNVGELGFLAIAPDNGEGDILFTLYPSSQTMYLALDDLDGIPPKVISRAVRRGNFHRDDDKAKDVFATMIQGVKAETLIDLIRVRLSQSIRIASQGHYDMGVPTKAGGERVFWLSNLISYR